MQAGIAFGSNVEPRLAHLQAARRRIRSLHPSPARCSRVYETAPVDCPPGSSPFLNAVLEITTPLDALSLLTHLQAIEVELGRPFAHKRHAPRTIDLDLLYCDNQILSHPSLTLPHPRICERRFVLQPLADIRPDLILPQTTQTVAALLENLAPDESTTLFDASFADFQEDSSFFT